MLPHTRNMNFPQRTFQEIFHHIHGKSVLDIGSAGQGNPEEKEQWLFGILEKHASSLIGIDVAPSTHPKVIQASAETFSIHEKFEVITLFDVIEHLDNVGLALMKIRKHLKPQGKLIITTPNMTSFGPFLDILFFRGITSNPTHTLGYNERMIKYTLERHGFQIQAFKYVGYPFFGNHKKIKKILSALRCIATYPLLAVWKEFCPTLLVIASPTER